MGFRLDTIRTGRAFLKSERRNILVESLDFRNARRVRRCIGFGYGAALSLSGCRIPGGKPESLNAELRIGRIELVL